VQLEIHPTDAKRFRQSCIPKHHLRRACEMTWTIPSDFRYAFHKARKFFELSPPVVDRVERCVYIDRLRGGSHNFKSQLHFSFLWFAVNSRDGLFFLRSNRFARDTGQSAGSPSRPLSEAERYRRRSRVSQEFLFVSIALQYNLPKGAFPAQIAVNVHMWDCRLLRRKKLGVSRPSIASVGPDSTGSHMDRTGS
jgi:hypothetical protein